MNYGKKGVRAKQKALNSKSVKWGKKAGFTFVQILLFFILSLGVIGASAGIGVFKGILATAPDIGNIDVTPSGFSTFVYDIEGNQIDKLVSTDANREPVSMNMVPQDMADAFVAIEDARFYDHNGIDIKGIIRAGVTGIRNKFHFSEGASTITQQLLKNNVFTDWTSEDSLTDRVKRKVQEQYLALELEKVMDKEDILINYMNTINLGQNTLGVQAASKRYFNKSVSTLTLSECAVIAGITQNPSKYNPITHPDKNKERREKVLNEMLDQGFISEDEYNEAIADDVYSRIQIADAKNEDSSVSTYFVDALTEDVLEDLIAAGYNETQAYTLLYSGGLKIYSTQDPTIQRICDEAFADENNFPANTEWLLSYELTTVKSNGDRENYSTEMFRAYWEETDSSYDLLYSTPEDAYADIELYKQAILSYGEEVFNETISLIPQPQVSLMIEDQSTGYVVAMEGGRGAKSGSRTFNRATNMTRQPGSTFKVVSTYAPAFDSAGLTLGTVLNDAPYNYADGRPVSNWYGKNEYRGTCSLREGIASSLNIIAVKSLTWITPQLGYDYLLNFGFTTLVEREELNGKIFTDIQQPLALGGITRGVTNEELNAAYASIANGGVYIKPKLYTRVLDHDGNVILDNTPPESKRVIKETTAFLLTDAMVDVVTSAGGTGGAVNFGNMAIAGKTGTTSDYNDVWFCGYTPYYTATVWAGYDNNKKLPKGEPRDLAKKLWRAVMSNIHEGLESEPFPVPSGIVTATVCSRSGKLPIEGLCSGTLRTEYFAEGTVPTETCDVHYAGQICQYTMLPATEMCPFKIEGVLELPLLEDVSIQSGYPNAMIEVVNEDGSVTHVPSTQSVTNICPHGPEFFADPNYEGMIAAQQGEINQRNLEAAAAAAAQAADPNAQPAPAEPPAPAAPEEAAPAAE